MTGGGDGRNGQRREVGRLRRLRSKPPAIHRRRIRYASEVDVEPLPADMGDLHRRLKQHQTGVGIGRIDSPTLFAVRDRQQIALPGRLPAATA